MSGSGRHVGDALRTAEVTLICVVPGSGFDPLFESYAIDTDCLIGTREEESVALAAGLRMAGVRVAVCMQQSGVGNCLNAVATLADAYDLHFPILVFDRGVNDDNPVQRVSSAATSAMLAAFDPVEAAPAIGTAAFTDLIERGFAGTLRWLWVTTA